MNSRQISSQQSKNIWHHRSTAAKLLIFQIGKGICKGLEVTARLQAVLNERTRFDNSSVYLAVHAEHLIHKRLSLNEAHREDIARVRGEIRDLYADLKVYKYEPGTAQSESLSRRFDVVFYAAIPFATLSRMLEGANRGLPLISTPIWDTH